MARPMLRNRDVRWARKEMRRRGTASMLLHVHRTALGEPYVLAYFSRTDSKHALESDARAGHTRPDYILRVTPKPRRNIR